MGSLYESCWGEFVKVRTWTQYVYVVVLTLFVAIIVRWLFLAFYYLPSSTMEPLVSAKSYVLIGKFSYGLKFVPGGSAYFHRDIKENDVILFSLPNRDEKIYLKRVVALSGQSLEVRDGTIYVNEQLVKVTDQKKWQLAKQVIPVAHVFVLNDNYSQMEDSRSFGPVPEKYVLGKFLLSFKF